MNNMQRWLMTMLIAVGLPAWALLPPLAQSVREMEAILEDPRLYDLLGSGETIEQILRTPEGYLVLTRRYAVRVELEYSSQRKIGPAEFELYFSDLIPLDMRVCP